MNQFMIAGVVVLYNPDTEKVIKNIQTYSEPLNKLLIIDNSEQPNQKVIDFFSNKDKFEYKSLGGNRGIAYALNQGIDFAISLKADLLLTMDQDSSFAAGVFERFTEIVKENLDKLSDGVIFSPVHKVPYLQKEQGITKVRSVMTSGNLINMALIDQIGYFDENLFIDSVDHEFCYRINQKGYSVYRVHAIELEHNLGEIEVKELFGKKIFVTNHNYIRRYYITRNSIYVAKRYSRRKIDFYRFVVTNLFWAFLSISLYEKDKLRKCRSIFQGFSDYNCKRFGKKAF